ncbi:hypothetical protein C8D75_1404 [Petrotoga olearia]|uniref:Uncharacterized protein n=2 Tax=Petrotoga olearia TaxID=156203 RepID=A0A2K1P0B9_9BACT|nr:hypothetical protein X929_06230 [Petrotoga olearia DSM 13574]RMA71517.1 hypothetical protein C8D75_1404 [Petrotoga olearia]
MKITDLRSEKIKIKLKKPFVISRGATEYWDWYATRNGK